MLESPSDLERKLEAIEIKLEAVPSGDSTRRKGIAQELVALLPESSVDSRFGVLYELAIVGADAAEFGPAVVPYLHDDHLVAGQAALTLGAMGPHCKEAIEPLISRMFTTRSQYLAQDCCRALAAYASLDECDPVLPLLVAGLGNASVNWTSIAPDILLESLKDSDRVPPIFGGTIEIRKTILFTISQMGPRAKSAVPEIRNLLQRNAGNTLGVSAADCIGAIGPDAAEAVPALLAVITEVRESDPVDPDPMVLKGRQILACAQAIGRIGKSDHNDQARPLLQDIAQDTDLDNLFAGVTRAAKNALAALAD